MDTPVVRRVTIQLFNQTVAHNSTSATTGVFSANVPHPFDFSSIPDENTQLLGGWG